MSLDPAVAGRFPLRVAPGAELRRYSIDDAEELFGVVVANRERLNRWMPWSDGVREVADQRAWLERHLDDLEGLGLFVDGRLVGGVGLTHDPFRIAGEIGYWIDAAFEGKGLVTAAVRAMIDVGFRDLGLHRIAIRAGVDNPRSRAIPQRLGFTREGVLRGEGSGSGGHGFHDLVVYGILEDEWPPG
jgi:ribosomal-protein-serine acetyltransferase